MMIVVDVKKAIIVSIATLIGSQLSFLITNRFEKDQGWMFDVTPHNREDGKILSDTLRMNNITILVSEAYNDNKEKVIRCIIYSENKEQSKLIKALIPKNSKCHVYEVKSFEIN